MANPASVTPIAAAKPASAAQSGLRWLWLAAIMLILDQVTKIYVANNFMLHESIAVMPMFNLTYVLNKGAAFSFLSEAGGWQRWFFTAIAVSISGLLLYWLRALDKTQKLLSIAYSLVLSGALGNLIDRVSYGHVIDFLDFYYNDSYRWPAFNIADAAICIGAILIIYDAITNKDDKTSTQDNK
ncbi:MAG: signal peptidase II [Psychrobium sp.]|nr:signal peptidase II [Psychrobium sp.]